GCWQENDFRDFAFIVLIRHYFCWMAEGQWQRKRVHATESLCHFELYGRSTVFGMFISSDIFYLVTSRRDAQEVMFPQSPCHVIVPGDKVQTLFEALAFGLYAT